MLDARTLFSLGVALATGLWLAVYAWGAASPKERRPRLPLEVAPLYIVGLSTALTQGLAPRVVVGSGFQDVALSAPAATGPLTQITPLANLAVLVLSVLIIVRNPPEAEDGRSRALLFGALAFAASGVFAGLLGAVPVVGPDLLIFPLVALALWRARLTVDRLLPHLRLITGTIIWASLLLVVLAPSRAFYAGQERSFVGAVRQLAGITLHPNYLGMVAALAVVLAFASVRRSWATRCYCVAAVLTLLLTQSRTSYAAAALGLSVLAYTAARRRRGILAATALIGWLASVLVASALILSPDWQTALINALTTTDLTTLNGRTRIWAAALGVFDQHPQFGYGWSVFSVEHRARLGLLASAGQAHNQFLHTLAERGAVGGIALAIYVITLWRSAWSSAEFAPVTRAVVVLMLPSLLTETPLQMSFVSNTAVLVHLSVLSLVLGGLPSRDSSLVTAGDEPAKVRD